MALVHDLKVSKKKTYDTRRVTSSDGTKHYGEIRYYHSKTMPRVYVAKRGDDQIFRSLNAWAIDKMTISALKCFAVKYVAVITPVGDKWVTSIDNFKSGIAIERDYSAHVGVAPGAVGELGANQWYLPLQYWVMAPAPASAKIARMAVGIK